jgi:hypothetical protein
MVSLLKNLISIAWKRGFLKLFIMLACLCLFTKSD